MIDTDDAVLDTRSGDALRPAPQLGPAVVVDLTTARRRSPGWRLARLAHRQVEDTGRSVRVQALERLGR